MAGVPLVPPKFKGTFAGATIALLLLIHLPDLVRGRPRLPGGWLDVALFSFLGWNLASSLLVSDSPALSLRSFLTLCLQVSLFYIASAGVGKEDVALATVSGGVPAAVVGILQYYQLGPFRRSPVFGSRITSTFSNPNHLSSFLGACLLILLGLSVKEEKLGKRLAIYLSVLLVYTSLLMAGTRGVFVGMASAGMASLVLLLRTEWKGVLLSRRREAAGLVLAMAAVTFLYSVPTPLNRGSRASERMASSVEILRAPRTKDTHILHRWLIWSVTADMIRSHPLTGVGYGTYGLEYASAQEEFLSRPENASRFRSFRPPPVTYAHNEYLHISAEAGIVGLALFLAFLSTGLVRAVHKFRSLDPGHMPIWLGVAGGLISILVHGLVSYPLHMPATSVLFWTLLGWLVAPLGPISHAGEHGR